MVCVLAAEHLSATRQRPAPETVRATTRPCAGRPSDSQRSACSETHRQPAERCGSASPRVPPSNVHVHDAPAFAGFLLSEQSSGLRAYRGLLIIKMRLDI